jgi:hypothetical protein
MHSREEERGRVPWIAALVLLALAAGLGAAIAHWRVPRAHAPPEPAAVDTSGDVVGRALEQAADSAAIRARWVDEINGLDLTGLDTAKREVFIRFANAERCTCGCGYTLAGCRAYDPTCEVSLPIVEALLDSVRRGLVRDTRGIRPRPKS